MRGSLQAELANFIKGWETKSAGDASKLEKIQKKFDKVAGEKHQLAKVAEKLAAEVIFWPK
jgi:hypothetical protein